MFAGLDDWGSVYDRHGRRPAYATVKAFHAYARAAVERHGGFVAKHEGEIIMASFPSAENAVRAGADIQRFIADLREVAPLGRLARVRVGINWGRVLREERPEGVDFFGNIVNAAARMMRLAGDGEVMVGGSALEDPGAKAALADATLETTSLKGFAYPITVLRLKPALAR